MYKIMLLCALCLSICLPLNAIANEDFAAEQQEEFKEMSPEEVKIKRQEILTMSKETLELLYKQHPQAKDEISKAYGYCVFKGKGVNLIMYVAGFGLGVAFDNETKTPIFMNAVRAGTGPGVGYKSGYGVLIFNNKTVYNQFTTVGLQVSAAGDASLKLAGKGVGIGGAMSLIPGVSYYQLMDTGIVLQVNWGATEFLKDPNLNQ